MKKPVLVLAILIASGCATVAFRGPADLTREEKIGQLFVYAATGRFSRP